MAKLERKLRRGEIRNLVTLTFSVDSSGPLTKTYLKNVAKNILKMAGLIFAFYNGVGIIEVNWVHLESCTGGNDLKITAKRVKKG